MTRPAVSHAEAWRPDSLRRLADEWDEAARVASSQADAATAEIHRAGTRWAGATADVADREAQRLAAVADAVARMLVLGAVAARDGAGQMAAAQAVVLQRVAEARDGGFVVADDGTVTLSADPDGLLVAMSGGDPAAARELAKARAQRLSAQIAEALDRLGAADADAARDIDEAFASPTPPATAATFPAGAAQEGATVADWPAMSQDRIGAQIAAMTAAQRQQLIARHPQQVGNTDGVPWDMRAAANRVNIAQAIVEDVDDPAARERVEFYRGLLAEIEDPALGGDRVDRQILAFDPQRSSLVELNGSLSAAGGVAVLVPGLNTTIEGSAANTATARRFVAATRGEVATITYLGGPFPRGDLIDGLLDAADPKYALDMAPRLVAFSEDVDRTLDHTGREIPVTVIGHSYGGSIVGTAESLGLTADRTLYVAAAGAGVGVDEPSDWHNRNPDVLRFSMTPPGDLIEAVQGIPGGPHGADPDDMPGVTRLPTGDYDEGGRVAGPRSHSDVLNRPSDAWRNILAVITGDSPTQHPAG